MHVLNDPELVKRLYLWLWVSLLVVALWTDPSLAFAGTGSIKLAAVGTNAFDSFSEYAQYGGAALFSVGAIPLLAGRELGGIGTGLVVVGGGLGVIRYVPDFLGTIKASGGLL